jgi:hypothetical protein
MLVRPDLAALYALLVSAAWVGLYVFAGWLRRSHRRVLAVLSVEIGGSGCTKRTSASPTARLARR